MKIDLTFPEAILVSCAVGEYKRTLRKQKEKMNPNDTLAKRIVKDSILELGTAYIKLGEAMRG